MSHWQSMAAPWIANATPKPSEARLRAEENKNNIY